MKKSSTNFLVHLLLKLMVLNYNLRPKYNKYLRSTQGWINYTIGFRTENDSVHRALMFKGGKGKVLRNIPDDVDVTLIFKNNDTIKEMLQVPPNELVNLLLKNRLRTKGKQTYLNIFNFHVAVLMEKKQKKMIRKQKKEDIKFRACETLAANPSLTGELKKRKEERLRAENSDKGVLYLEDPYLSDYELDDFPRVKEFLDVHFNSSPWVCHERPKLITDFFMKNGYVTDNGGKESSELKLAGMFKFLMENKKPIIRKNDLIAGTTTTKDIGVVIYPDAQGLYIWGELKTIQDRLLNPYKISEETIDVLHNHVFPYWLDRNFREWVRKEYSEPLCQKLDERFAVYFNWKPYAISHIIPDFEKFLGLGIKGIVKEVDEELKRDKNASIEKKDYLNAMKLCYEGLISYSKGLLKQAELEYAEEFDTSRKNELKRLTEILSNVPENPATTLDEAINAYWFTWIALHMENTNVGISLGRVDQIFQPYFESDIKKLKTKAERDEYIKKTIELIGCLYMRFTDHLPLTPDLGNYVFGGSSSNQALTLGGITPEGEDAVNDMTYIFLKVIEMLGIRDPNENARFNLDVNSEAYLKRLCEVNLMTTGTPSMHNDNVVMESIREHNFAPEELRDWTATGCVEPTIPGKQVGHTNFNFMNIIAALEMSLNNGYHPLMNWNVGPETGRIQNGINSGNGDFMTFDDFFNAFKIQLQFLIDQSVEYNNILGRAHSILRPTPFLSSLISGCITDGKDVTRGGARYNTSGSACIGLADATDSLMVIKKLVYEEKKVTFSELKETIDNNFENNPALHAMVTKKVKLFGSGSEEAVGIANEIAKFIHDTYFNHTNFRGGKYTTGFWSTSFHAAFGNLTGALPSGRLSGKAFSPGLTPSPNASKNLLDNLRDVAKLDPKNMNNNIAFNVKIVPGINDSHKDIVDNMHSYVKTYFDLGGMQLQFNVVNTEMLRDAMQHPDAYQNLLVRISGYNAYFVTLDRNMQMELIERAEYGI